jgi:hypothetical protein
VDFRCCNQVTPLLGLDPCLSPPAMLGDPTLLVLMRQSALSLLTSALGMRIAETKEALSTQRWPAGQRHGVMRVGTLFELGGTLQVRDVSIIRPGTSSFRRAAAATAGAAAALCDQQKCPQYCH